MSLTRPISAHGFLDENVIVAGRPDHQPRRALAFQRNQDHAVAIGHKAFGLSHTGLRRLAVRPAVTGYAVFKLIEFDKEIDREVAIGFLIGTDGQRHVSGLSGQRQARILHRDAPQ